jgi:hypothetical protein
VTGIFADVKKQFNVNLDPDLIRRVKHHSIDVQLSVSDLVASILNDHLKGSEAMGTQPEVVLQPMVHVKDMAGTLALLEVLGGTVRGGSRDGDWVQVCIGGAEVGLLKHPANPEQGEGDVELNFQSNVPLDQVEDAARSAGVEVAVPTTDKGFGRQLQLRTPDGLLVKVNELDPSLFT